MTPDELREKIALTLVLVAQWRGHDKFSFVDTDKAADAVMLVLAEALAGKDAEIADLWRRVDAVAELLSAQHLRNRRLSALLRGMARRVGQIRRDAETNVGHLAHQADDLHSLALADMRDHVRLAISDCRDIQVDARGYGWAGIENAAGAAERALDDLNDEITNLTEPGGEA